MRMLGALGEVGDQPPLAALGCAFVGYGFARRDSRAARAGAGMLGALLLTVMATGGLKRLVSRTRPHVLLDEGRYAVTWLGRSEGPSRSFPSGHTAGSVAVALAVGRAYPDLRRTASFCALAVALVQLPRGAHYPLDIAAGALIGRAAEGAAEELLLRACGAGRLRAAARPVRHPGAHGPAPRQPSRPAL